MVKTPTGAIGMLVLTLMLAGCSGEGGDDEAKKAGAPDTAAQVPPVASLTVKADKTHAVQPKDEITLTIDVGDFRLAPESIGGSNQDGVGHYRVYLDDASGDDFLLEAAEPTTRVVIPEDISDGSHDLRVVLHNNDRSPVEPRVEGSVLLIVYRL